MDDIKFYLKDTLKNLQCSFNMLELFCGVSRSLIYQNKSKALQISNTS